MTRVQIIERLGEVLQESSTNARVDWGSVTEATEIDALGFDSLTILDLIFDIEEAFGLEVPAEDDVAETKALVDGASQLREIDVLTAEHSVDIEDPDLEITNATILDPLIEFLEIGSNMGWPLFAPPGIPAERLAALRLAFSDMLQSEEFAEAMAASMRTPINPTEGEALQLVVETALETPESVVTEAKNLLGI